MIKFLKNIWEIFAKSYVPPDDSYVPPDDNEDIWAKVWAVAFSDLKVFDETFLSAIKSIENEGALYWRVSWVKTTDLTYGGRGGWINMNTLN